MKHALSFVMILLAMCVGSSQTHAMTTVTICNGDTTILGGTVPDGVVYYWNTGAQTPSIAVSPSSNTTYMRTVWNINFVIILQDTFNVVVKPKPSVIITSPNGQNAVCIGGSLQLTANSNPSPIHYLWNTGDTTMSIVASPTVSPTVYTVTATNNGCNTSASFTVYIQGSPMMYTITGDSTYCGNQPGVLIGLNGSESDCWYKLYQNGMGIANVNGTGYPISFGTYPTGTYTVKGFKNTLGCSAQMNGTLHVTAQTLPQSAGPIIGLATVCQNTITTYFVDIIPYATSYDWSIPTEATIISGQGTRMMTINFGNASSGDIKVRGHNNCGDGPSSSLFVTVHLIPSLSITATDTEICAGESVVLIANTNANTIVWDNGLGTSSSITVCPVTTTTYSVTVTGANGCITTGSITITVHQLPAVSLTLTPNHICNDVNTLVLEGGSPAGGTYTAPTGFPIIGKDTLYVSLSSVGTYPVTYTFTSVEGCSNSATALFTINPVIPPQFDPIGGTIYNNTPPFDLTPFVYPTGGVFTGPGMFGSIFDPQKADSGDNMITYTYTHPITGCVASQIQYIKVGPLGVRELSVAIENITLFPNPSVSILNITGIDIKRIRSLKIIHLNGKSLYMTNTTTDNIHINISHYAAGTYIIRFTDTDGLSLGKTFVKQ